MMYKNEKRTMTSQVDNRKYLYALMGDTPKVPDPAQHKPEHRDSAPELTVDEDILDEGDFECPECGEVIDFATADVEEVEFEDEDEEE